MTVYNGTSGADNYTGANRGTTSADTYYTYAGSDVIDSYLGNDFISAGDGNDTIYAGDGNDQVYGGNQNDTIFGDLGNDSIYGEAGDDIIDGGLQDDLLDGGAGNDTFLHDGIGGWDSYYGGSDTDTIKIENISPDALYGLIQITYLSGVERIINLQGSKPVDIKMTGSLDLSLVEVDGIRSIIGSGGNDAITGTSNLASGSINDTIKGEGGNDILDGGVGNDILTGGSGSDRYVFGASKGSDTIADFANGADIIDLRPTAAASISDLIITTVGPNTQIVVDGTTITLTGIAISAIDASDFLF